ncbi:VOC family protein [Dactylosporangium darangshiense]|uniref:VOC family protein n=1 Tax=Dactylosporangium darangshiense TaxID=579108 RepID=A0ABP8DQ51_9ACTN
MSINVFGLTYDAVDAKAAATFWAAALGRTVADGADHNHAVVEAGDDPATGPRIGFHRVPEGKTAKNRLHLDLISGDFPAELARLEALGAKQIASFDAWTTLADPEGNEFDLIRG